LTDLRSQSEFRTQRQSQRQPRSYMTDCCVAWFIHRLKEPCRRETQDSQRRVKRSLTFNKLINKTKLSWD